MSVVSQSALRGRALMPHLDGAIGGGTVDSVGEHVHADGAHGAWLGLGVGMGLGLGLGLG